MTIALKNAPTFVIFKLLNNLRQKNTCHSRNSKEADEEIRTLDILLGKEMLYH